MKPDRRRSPSPRHYPRLYEKLIPLAMVLLLLALTAVVVIALAVGLRLLPGAGG